MPDELGDPEYPDGFEVRRVRQNGCFRLNHIELPASVILTNEAIGLEPVDDGLWQVWFGPIYLGLATELGRGKVDFKPNRPYQKP